MTTRTTVAVSDAAPHPSLGFATCPLCHTTDTAMTTGAVETGADWRCVRCGQPWSATRLVAVAAYAAWASEALISSVPRH